MRQAVLSGLGPRPSLVVFRTQTAAGRDLLNQGEISLSQPSRSDQRLTFLAAGLLWAVFPFGGVAALLVAYLAALALVNWVVLPIGGDLLASASRGQRWLVVGAIALVPVSLAVGHLASFNPIREWEATREAIGDRLALERTPSISPPLLVSSQPQRFYVSAPDARDVSLQWTPDSAQRQMTSLGSGTFFLDYDPHDDPLISRLDEGALSARVIVDGEGHARTLSLVHPQPHPRWFSAAADVGIAATVSEETDELIIVRRDGSFRRVAVDDGPTDCVLLDGGRQVAVVHRYSPFLLLVDTESGEIRDRREVGPFQVRVAVSPEGDELAIARDGAQGGVRVLPVAGAGLGEFVELSFSPDWIAYGRDADELIVTHRQGLSIHRAVRQADGWRDAGNPIVLPRPVVTLVRDQDGQRIWLTATAAETFPAMIPANHFVQDALHELHLAPWEIVRTHVTDRRSPFQELPGGTDLGVSPMGLASSADGLQVVFAGSGEVAFLSADTGQLDLMARLDDLPLVAPHGVADLGEGVWCVSSPSQGTIGVFDRRQELVALVELAESADRLAEVNPNALQRRRGEESFFESTRRGLSCQSCHLHGETDHCRHNIGQNVLVGTLSISGLTGTAPYLRDGGHPQLRDLHEVSELVYEGYTRFVPWDRAAALNNYMASLPPRRNPLAVEATDVDALRHGYAAFVKADCHLCHAPPAMTNLGQHPLRFLFPEFDESSVEATGTTQFVDTPSLRGILFTAPYLHDGRAASLREVLIDFNRHNRHGNVQALAPAEIAALLDFLERL